MEYIYNSDLLQLQSLEQNLKVSIFGQDEAINSIVEKLMISTAGLSETNKPLASFLFTGSTGVGKTELAIELAKNHNLEFIRFDMSEYSSDHSVSTLIGAASGLKGYDEGGLLTNKIKEHPKSVLLLDEIEKADKIILNTFLQVLDYGTLTDTKGNKIDFSNVIIIMTSNLGANAKSTMGFGSNSSDNRNDEINKFLSPEFRARIDSQIEFNPLTKDMVKNIATKFIDELELKLHKQIKTMELTSNAFDEIVDQAFTTKLGARHIKKVINNTIKQKLAYELLFGEFKTNDSVTIDFIDNNFVYLFSNNSPLNNTNIFQTAYEAQEYAKANPGVTITRTEDGQYYKIKE